MQPFVKWAGGKRSLLPTILEHSPSFIKNYFEPFVGGGAVFFGLVMQDSILNRAYLNDINGELINAYTVVRDDVDDLIKKLQKHAKLHCEEHFYKTRARTVWTPATENVDRAARMIYLNRTCFNGLYRVNRKGEFNVPIGSYKNPIICDEVNLQSCSRVLRRTLLSKKDFEKAVAKAGEGDFAYFDPPYMPRVGEEFVGYDSSGFGLEEHRRLRDCVRTLKKIGVNVMVSNSGADEVRELYKRGFKLREVWGARTIGATGDRRGHHPDLLIT